MPADAPLVPLVPAEVPTLATPDPNTAPDLAALPAWGMGISNADGHDYLTFGATVWNAGGVAVLEFHSKMNALGKGVIEMVHRALDIVAEQGLTGLVIGNEDPRTFTAGADLKELGAASITPDLTRKLVARFLNIIAQFEALPDPSDHPVFRVEPA